ncbi:hypothetical protein SCLCIDRAFT_116417 [Scleroderma citrinum Foug A]|uniref:Cysteine-rich protein n=1 Tax=Scleroderma citrinum Foug A TaxID=1036808 RepID=A0A0C3E642_9AGAM|nr:hypothetical protein SCLCIDRAFT_116417 [Scleroderma citrinum Foug A]
MNFKAIATVVLLATPVVMAGPIAYGLCQTGCNILAGACYATAGCVFGTVAAPTAPAAILACNSAQGTCMAICAVVALAAPVP